MALIAVLLPDSADRDALYAAISGHRFEEARDWRDLTALVKRAPVAAAVADLRAEPGKDGALRVLRFSTRYPRTPLVVWGTLDGRDLYRVGKAGAFDVVIQPEVGRPDVVGERVGAAAADPLAQRVNGELSTRVVDDGRALVRSAASRIGDGVQVPELADVHGYSVSTLERRCQEWQLPTPGRILLWLRLIYGLNWLLEPGRSVESVAGQIGYSSGAAFRRAISTTMDVGADGLRTPDSLERAVVGFVSECGDPVASREVA